MFEHIRRIESTAALFFGKGLILYVILWYGIFVGVGFAVASIFEYGSGDEARDPNLRNILLSVDFIISWVYFLLLRDAIEGYSAAGEAYTRMLVLCREMAQRTLALAEHGAHVLLKQEGLMHTMLPPPTTRGNLRQRSNGVVFNLSRAGAPVISMDMPVPVSMPPMSLPAAPSAVQEAGEGTSESAPLYGYPLDEQGGGGSGRPLAPRLSPDPTQGYTEMYGTPYGPGPRKPEAIPPQELQQRVLHEREATHALLCIRDASMAICWYTFRLYQPADDRTLQMPDSTVGGFKQGSGVPEITREYAGNVNQMLRVLLCSILVNISALQRLDELNTGRANIITDAYVQLSGQVRDIEVATFSYNPRIFKQHLMFIMFIFLAVWMPFSMWLTVGWKLTVIFYPMLMFLLSGPFLYRAFLGESFDPQNRSSAVNHHDQRVRTVQEINELYHPERSALRRILHATPTHL